MGTDPPIHAVNMRHSAEVDYAALDTEYRELAGQIKALGSTPAAQAPEDQLIITAQVPLWTVCSVDSTDSLPFPFNGGCIACLSAAL